MTRWFLTFLMLLVPTIMHAAVYISEIAWPRPDTISRCVLGLGKMGTALAILLLPHYSNAAVYFSEIAWMGTSNSANDEWIELHNSGSTAVDLSGWRLTDNLNFDITLEGAGSVAPGAFAVLERTDDTSAPGTAFFIYTGSLANTGATLRLYDASGALIDQVAGGENWENLGGDNTTKETVQYTNGGWVTAAPTPGTASAAATTDTSAKETATNQSVTGNATGDASPAPRSSTASREPTTPLGLQIVAPSVGYVAQPIDFSVELRGRGADAKSGRHIIWNFGDTHTGSGRTATHQYPYPGTYVVTARGTYKQLDDVLVRHEITILPVALSITRNRDGAVQLSNTAKYELALGSYTVAAAGEEYTLPPDTFVKPNATITLPPQVLAPASHEVVAVHDQAAQVVAYDVPGTPRLALAAASADVSRAQPQGVARNAPAPSPNQNFAFASEPAVAAPPTPQILATSTGMATAESALRSQTASVINAIPAAAASQEESGLATTNRPQNATAYLALIGLLLLAIVALFMRQPKY